MLAEIGQPLKAPLRQTATHILVFDDYGQPIVAIYEFAGSIVLSKAGDADFESVLRNFGLQPAKIKVLNADTFVRP